MITEQYIFEQIREGKIDFYPLSFRLIKEHPVFADNELDAIVEVSWLNEKIKFVVEIKSLFTPKAFRNALNLLKRTPLPSEKEPMLILPYLDNEKLKILEQEKISGIDLCGNGIVIVPGKFAVFRTGSKNRYSTSAPIKNIYRKNSSMVARTFVSCPQFETVQEILSFINNRNLLVSAGYSKPMSLSTVSKSLKTLLEDLIINRTDSIRLMQPDKLLEKLEQNYDPPKITNRIKVKIPDTENILELIQNLSQELKLPLIASGTSSVSRYAVMQRGPTLEIFCPRLDGLIKHLPVDKSDRFPNCELIETNSERVFFDARNEDSFWWASPLQTYLELMVGDKRDQETAGQIKTKILNDMKRTIK